MPTCEGIPQDFAETVKLYRKAAEKRHGKVQTILDETKDKYLKTRRFHFVIIDIYAFQGCLIGEKLKYSLVVNFVVT